MTKPIIKIHNLETGEEIEREMTKSEYEKYLADQASEQEKAQAIAQKQAARQSALEKLAALGLTEDEIRALAG